MRPSPRGCIRATMAPTGHPIRLSTNEATMADQTQTQTKTPATYDVTLTMEGPADAQYPVGFTAKWSNGATMQVDARTLSDSMQLWCMVHGLKQKVFDAAAIARDPKTGKSATVAQKFEAANDV